MLFFAMEFRDLTIDGLINTGALSSRHRTNQTKSTPENPKGRSSTRFSNHDSERTIRNTSCNNRIATQNGCDYICIAFHSHGHFSRSFNGTLNFATQRHSVVQ